MIDFSNQDELKKLDPKDTYGSTKGLLKQCEAAWNEVNVLNLPPHLGEIKNIVFCGMGASIYGALVLKALYGRSLPFPIEIISDYFVPDYVDSNSLVVLTSYSGTTEEVISCGEDAKSKNAKIIVLTKGGPLSVFAKENEYPAYIFDGKLNPAGVPRLGNGYTILGLIGLLNKTGVIDIEEHEIENSLIRLTETKDVIRNQAQNDYKKYIGKIPVIFAAEHLAGNAQILRNQFNETSKTFSSFFLIPDLNHHLMEGLKFPEKSPLEFIILNSPNYSEKIKKRVKLTSEVVRENKFPVHDLRTSGSTIYEDFLEVLQYGSYLTLFLALEYKQNPATNPWVDYFKEKLAK